MKKYIPNKIIEKYRYLRAMILSIGLNKNKKFIQSDRELNASADYSVIVAIHDAPQVTLRCLQSLAVYGGKAEVILINDGSKLPETISIINEFIEAMNWRVIHHEKAQGHSQACRTGVLASERKYLCLLNSDTVLTPWSWCGTTDAFESEPRIAITGPTTSWAGTDQSLTRAEHCRMYWNDSQICDFSEKYVSGIENKTWVDLPEISGFAFFMRRAIWDEFDGFNVNLPGYGNETELCKRISKTDYRMVWTKNSYIHHFGRSSFSGVLTKDEIRKKRQAAKAYIDNMK